MATTNRPQALAAKDISSAVEKAVKLAADKHKVKFAPEFHIGPGIIMGRLLMQADIAVKQAEQIANDITEHVNQQGARGATLAHPRFEPAVLVRNDLILCGFYPGPIPEIQQQF
jgi:hypothetical protein